MQLRKRRAQVSALLFALWTAVACSDASGPPRSTKSPVSPQFDVYEGPFSPSLDGVEDLEESTGDPQETTGNPFVCPQRVTGGWRITYSGDFGTKSFLLLGPVFRVSHISPQSVPPTALYDIPGRRYSSDGTVWIEGLRMVGTCNYLWNPTGYYLGNMTWSAPTIDRWGYDESLECPEGQVETDEGICEDVEPTSGGGDGDGDGDGEGGGCTWWRYTVYHWSWTLMDWVYQYHWDQCEYN